MSILTVNDIYTMLSHLDADDKKWLADRLLDDVSKETAVEKSASWVYPKLPKDFEVSEPVKKLVVAPVPEDFDFNAETDKMWEELAK